MIFIDSNVPMYLIGAAHPHKTEAHILTERLIAAGERLGTDAEVLQEILHRYTAIGRRQAVNEAFRVILDLVDEVFPIEKSDVLRAAEITQIRSGLSARDALHVAVMQHHGVSSIFSFDADFDRLPGLRRIHQM